MMIKAILKRDTKHLLCAKVFQREIGKSLITLRATKSILSPLLVKWVNGLAN